MIEVHLVITFEIHANTVHGGSIVYDIVVYFIADRFFPEIKASEFDMIWGECHHPDEKNKYEYCFEKWVRRK